ncbi:MAG: DUF1028 domain-containing protein [Chloroflexota bacterium]|nr:DUF1028 domain-containing protein [Chloroflexota bacterium]
MTFSIVAFDPTTDEIGVAVATKNLAVGSVVPWAKAKVGAIATQASANVDFGPKGLRLLETKSNVTDVLDTLINSDSGRDHRQIGIVNSNGETSAYTGKSCVPWAGHFQGEYYSCQGNMLTGEQVVKSLAQTFEVTNGLLPERMIAGLESAESAGGDKRGKQSAAIYIAKLDSGWEGKSDRYIDLRIDDHIDPIPELKKLLFLHRKQHGI